MEDKEQKKPDLSVVVPVYNEEENVIPLHGGICQACDALPLTYEVIYVNDGSRDSTLDRLRALGKCTIVDLRKNFGQTAALDAGIKQANGRVIVTMDGDLQNDPADIPALLAKLDQGLDVVSGWRHQRKDPVIKRAISRGANVLRKFLINDGIHDSGCTLKAYRAECFDGVDLYGEMHRFIPAILKLSGFRIGEAKVNHRPRIHGTSTYTWKRMVKGAIDMMSIWFWRKYANRPLHLFGAIGLLLSAIGIALGIWALVLKLAYDTDLSDTSLTLAAVFSFLIGIQLFISGILADIAIKSYYASPGRRMYDVREIIVSQADEDTGSQP